jgi:hypothetical protein
VKRTNVCQKTVAGFPDVPGIVGEGIDLPISIRSRLTPAMSCDYEAGVAKGSVHEGGRGRKSRLKQNTDRQTEESDSVM